MTSGAAAGSQPMGTAGKWLWQVSFEDGPKNRSYGGPADKSLWLDMSEEHNIILEDAVAGSQPSVELLNPYKTKKGEWKTSKLHVDFTTMTQINQESNKERKVRRVQLWQGLAWQEDPEQAQRRLYWTSYNQGDGVPPGLPTTGGDGVPHTEQSPSGHGSQEGDGSQPSLVGEQNGVDRSKEGEDGE